MRINVYDECFKEEPGDEIRNCHTNNMWVAQILIFSISIYNRFDSPGPFFVVVGYIVQKCAVVNHFMLLTT